MVEGLLCLGAQMAYCEHSLIHDMILVGADRLLGILEVSALDHRKYTMFLIHVLYLQIPP